MLRTPALIAVAIGASVMTATPALAAKPPTGLINSISRDLGISTDQAVSRLANEARGNSAAPSLSKRIGDDFAGIWYEGAESTLVAASTDAADTAAIAAAGAKVRIVPRTLAQLTSVKDTLDGMAPPSSVHAWAISPQDNAVIVDASDEAAAKAWIASSGADASAVQVRASAGRPKPLYEIRGGDAYYTSQGYRCSIGFAARRGTALGFTSAGHCGTPGVTTTGYNQVAQGSFQLSSFPGDDFSWVQTNADWTAAGVVNGYSAGILPVRGAAVTQPGGSVCRSGSTTQWHCGTVQALNSTVNYPEGSVSGLTRTNVCAEGGDSGGSFISGDQAQGMTSGGSGNCTSGGTTYFQPIAEALSRGGLTLVTSGGTQPPPTGCTGYSQQFSGSLSSGQSAYQPNNSYYQSTVSGNHAACLDGPTGTDFDLYLQKWNGSAWAVVATSDSANPDETISYNGTSGYYRYRVTSYTGSGAYTLGVNHP
jgi:streptogrisin C